MPTPRKLDFNTEFPYRTDGLCRCGCGLKPVKPRKFWVSDECVRRAQIHCGDVGQIRAALRARDKGICALCGCDTYAMKRELNRLWREDDRTRFNDESTRLRRMGFRTGNSWWAADHIRALMNGGAHSLDNLATLCIPCHKKKTRADHRARKSNGQQIALAIEPAMP